MYILGFIVLLVVVGFFIGLLVEDEETAFGIILVITIIWAFMFGPWAVATFIELIVGYSIGLGLSRDRESIDSFAEAKKEKNMEDMHFDLHGLKNEKSIEDKIDEGLIAVGEKVGDGLVAVGDYNVFTRFIRGLFRLVATLWILGFFGLFIWGCYTLVKAMVTNQL